MRPDLIKTASCQSMMCLPVKNYKCAEFGSNNINHAPKKVKNAKCDTLQYRWAPCKRPADRGSASNTRIYDGA